MNHDQSFGPFFFLVILSEALENWSSDNCKIYLMCSMIMNLCAIANHLMKIQKASKKDLFLYKIH